MTDRPIIFSAPMVRALLDGRKTMTRRLATSPLAKCAVGDRLWVRENYARVGDNEDDIHACPDLRTHAYYRADSSTPEQERWRPSIHMPRWASRFTLFVTDVRRQRLHDITEEDAQAEGADQGTCPTELGGAETYREGFADLWESIHGLDAWDANLWVCALTFTVHRANIDTLPVQERAS